MKMEKVSRSNPKLETYAFYPRSRAAGYYGQIKCFDEALRLDPNFAKTKNNRDTALKALERTSEAGAANFYTPSSQKSITSDSSSNSNRCDQVVHVKGYTTKKGKYVAPYDRRPPGC
jgi:hypothetical protein